VINKKALRSFTSTRTQLIGSIVYKCFFIILLTQYGPKNLQIKLLTQCIFGHVSTIMDVVEISIILLPVTNHTAPYERWTPKQFVSQTTVNVGN